MCLRVMSVADPDLSGPATMTLDLTIFAPKVKVNRRKQGRFALRRHHPAGRFPQVSLMN
jgi:hypothetical protein